MRLRSSITLAAALSLATLVVTASTAAHTSASPTQAPRSTRLGPPATSCSFSIFCVHRMLLPYARRDRVEFGLRLRGCDAVTQPDDAEDAPRSPLLAPVHAIFR